MTSAFALNSYGLSDRLPPRFEQIDLTFEGNEWEPRHRWYPFVEGFGSTFVRKCIVRSGAAAGVVLDPFCGTGTTVLAAQQSGFQATGIEINPQLAMVARAKTSRIKAEVFRSRAEKIVASTEPMSLKQMRLDLPGYPTLGKGNRFGRWLYHDNVLRMIMPLAAISRRHRGEMRDLLLLALARLAAETCNAKKDGKALRYRREWRARRWSVEEVRGVLLSIYSEIGDDLESVEIQDVTPRSVVHEGSALDVLPEIRDETVDCVVTSPPYLNSRDYTDLLNAEMWLLGFVKSYAGVRRLRNNCVSSHMQIVRGRERLRRFDFVEKISDQMRGLLRPAWQRRVPDMIGGYFDDLGCVLEQLYRVLKAGGVGFVNVAESAYGGVKIPTLDVIAEIARRCGFGVRVEVVRTLRRSPQQFYLVPSLAEGLVEIRKG